MPRISDSGQGVKDMPPRPFRAHSLFSALPGMLSPANIHKPSGLPIKKTIPLLQL